MTKKLVFGILLAGLVSGQETSVKNTNIFSDENGGQKIGTLNEGAKIQKLRKSKDGKFVRATLEFYVPVESLINADVYANMGTQQRSGSTLFRLQKVEKNENRVKAYLDIKNEGSSKMKFTAAVLTKMTASGGNNGDLNPFEGENQGFVEVPPKKSVSAVLVFDFKSKPEGLVFSCKEKMAGEEIQYSVPD